MANLNPPLESLSKVSLKARTELKFYPNYKLAIINAIILAGASKPKSAPGKSKQGIFLTFSRYYAF